VSPQQPILSCEQSREFEERLFHGDEALEWSAMQLAGHALAKAIPRDFLELGALPAKGRLLVLAGKGHNGGDALLAAAELLCRHPGFEVDVLPVFGSVGMKPLARRALRLLQEQGHARVCVLGAPGQGSGGPYLLSLDGIFGFQFRAPMPELALSAIAWEATQEVRMRVSVDLPSGLDAPGAYEADFTYATGIAKTPILSCPKTGRVRHLDLGFFDRQAAPQGCRDWVIDRQFLRPLAVFRKAKADKRSFGHVYIVGGSRSYPGAVLMSVLGALRSGAGLVTAFVPESLVPSFAARAPEAMWVGWPETPEGGLALEGCVLLESRLARASALVLGPGLGREPETLAMAERIVQRSTVPTLIDADALQARVVRAGTCPRILTPHAGEYLRIAGGLEPMELSRQLSAVLVVKGPVTQVVWDGQTYHSFCGGPVLARGGSGDLLAGIIGGLLAQEPADPAQAAARGVVWQGCAADLLARAQGPMSAATTDLLAWLPQVLREAADE
jgi:NAD(P)H-hydrate epimerase